MPKLLIRIVAIFLVPSLIADPNFAAVFTAATQAQKDILSEHFNQEALSGRVAAAIFTGKTGNAGSHEGFHRLFKLYERTRISPRYYFQAFVSTTASPTPEDPAKRVLSWMQNSFMRQINRRTVLAGALVAAGTML